MSADYPDKNVENVDLIIEKKIKIYDQDELVFRFGIRKDFFGVCETNLTSTLKRRCSRDEFT